MELQTALKLDFAIHLLGNLLLFVQWLPRLRRPQVSLFPLGQGGPQRSFGSVSIESKKISNQSNRKSPKSSNGRKIARMARILTIFDGIDRLAMIYFSKILRTTEKLSNRSNRSTRSSDRAIDRIDRRPPCWWSRRRRMSRAHLERILNLS